MEKVYLGLIQQLSKREVFICAHPFQHTNETRPGCQAVATPKTASTWPGGIFVVRLVVVQLLLYGAGHPSIWRAESMVKLLILEQYLALQGPERHRCKNPVNPKGVT